jgi:hypothetical protein
MMQFNLYLAEAASEEKLKHLEHAEDHVINSGMEVLEKIQIMVVLNS